MGAAPSGDESALAIPRPDLPGSSGVSLPRPLAPSHAALIRRIFALQAKGDIPAAIRESGAVEGQGPLGGAMLGHLLADRYLGPHTRPDAGVLRDWLDRWAELPDARDIHRLLVVRLPAGAKAPPPPGFAAAPEPAEVPVPEDSIDAGIELPRNPELDRSVWEAARARGAAGVERLLRRTAGLTTAYAGQLRGEAARVLFTLDRDAEAMQVAGAGMARCGAGNRDGCDHAALPGFVAGLAAWRLGRFADARDHFAAGWRAEVTTPALSAGAAFWAARTEQILGDDAAARIWLRRAAERSATFYGLIARRALGLPPGARHFGPGERETLGEADVEAVAALPGGLRAFALLQVGQPERAAAELRQLWPRAQASRPLARALMLTAEAAGLPDTTTLYADLLAAADGRPRERMRFPAPRLRPAGGFTVDPALVYGMARTESNFDSGLVSSAGARGLMQIMPETASFIVGRGGGNLAGALHDPAVNLDLGQRYIAYLATHEVVDGDLIRLIAAYNAGPGSFARWGPQVRDRGDPLLFIEAIPLEETRAHVPRVLTYTWIYAAQMRLPTPSLDELAAGLWPRYRAPERKGPAAPTLH